MDFLCSTASCKAFIAFAAFAFVYVSDILLGVINNVVINGQPFAWRRLFNSFIKVVVGVLVLAALVTAELLAGKLELPVSQDTVGLVSLTAFVLLFWQGFREGVTGIYQKLRNMFGIKGAETPATGEIDAPDPREIPFAAATADENGGTLQFDTDAPETALPEAQGTGPMGAGNADDPGGQVQTLEYGGIEFLDDEDADDLAHDFEIKDGE